MLSKSRVPVKRIEEGIPEGLDKMFQSHLGNRAGTCGTRRPALHWPQKPTSPSPSLSSPSLISAEADSHQGPEMSRELGRLILSLRAAPSPRLRAGQNPGQRHRTVQGCGGKRCRSRRPIWGSVRRSSGTPLPDPRFWGTDPNPIPIQTCGS